MHINVGKGGVAAAAVNNVTNIHWRSYHVVATTDEPADTGETQPLIVCSLSVALLEQELRNEKRHNSSIGRKVTNKVNAPLGCRHCALFLSFSLTLCSIFDVHLFCSSPFFLLFSIFSLFNLFSLPLPLTHTHSLLFFLLAYGWKDCVSVWTGEYISLIINTVSI